MGKFFYQGNLDDKQRELITLVVLATNQTLPQLKAHVSAALNVGLTPVEIKEAVYQCAPYIGFPKTLNAINVVNEVFKTKNIALPIESQNTVDEDNRFDKGLAVQVEIFGAVIGKIDVLVNNAGLMPQAFLAENKVDEWDKMIDVNIRGVLYAIAAIVPSMRERKSGHVINLSSVAGHNVYPGGTVYCGTKFAVRAISEGLRQEEAMSGNNIRVTNVSPGAISSELLETTTDPTMKAGLEDFYQVAIPAERIARTIAFVIEQPEDVAINELIVRPTVQVG